MFPWNGPSRVTRYSSIAAASASQRRWSSHLSTAEARARFRPPSGASNLNDRNETMAKDYPDDLRYTKEHEWARIDEKTKRALIGITSYAVEHLGDITMVEVPKEGEA